MGEASDMDSGIMLHSGPNSPVSPLKERVQVGQRQQQALEAQLDGCIQELRRLCLREAELTGTLPCEYPLKAGEKPPKVRRRIGAAFKLDEIAVLRGVDPLERERALQLQIAEASRRLCREENIGRQVRKRRQTAALREEQKLRDLEQVLSQRRLLAGQQDTNTAKGPCPIELSASDESSIFDTRLLEEEDTQPPGPAIPQRSPSPKDLTKEEEEESGLLMPPTIPWQETSLDRPYERAKNPSIDPEDGETQTSQCYLGSLMAAPASSPDSSGSPVCRTGDPPYRFVPIRTLVLCRQAGSSASSAPQPSGRQEQTQSLRVDPCWQPAEPRGRSAAPRRRPTYYTVTVPTSCILTPGPACHSGSDDSISDLSSISHATSPGSSSPDTSFAVPLHLAPGHYPRGALQLLPPAGPLTFLYEQDLAPLRYQRLVPSRSRIVRTPSLKDYAPAGARGLSKAAVTEELKSWHQRARLRGARPHSLDRQGAFQRPHGGTTRDVPIAHGILSLVQDPPVQVLRRSAASVPVQFYTPENGEIVTQV
ncbi:innate immunity activator protein isoform X2 [Motacilla alba alba]|uniref:innate immunity activator protein isoform X2 n=1 Tax=Motacilla alba alba TaxID=1094192 RepID=UPI0018D572E2|nr:innate immunity activator protein isoform X2 [Motacilla alba alba]